MFIAPGPMDAVTARVAWRWLCLANAVAAWTRACSLRPWMNGIVLGELVQGLPEAGDVAVAEDAERGRDQPAAYAVGDGVLAGQVGDDGLRDGQPDGGGCIHGETRFRIDQSGSGRSDYQGRPCRMTVFTSVISATAERGPSLPMPLPFRPPYGIRSARHSGRPVDVDHAGVDLPDRPHRTGDVGGEHARAEPVRRAVGLRDRALPVVGDRDRHRRAEQLVLAERRRRIDVGDHRRRHHRAVALRRR